MLLSLISVLVLLVIGFYALWVAATGRVSGPESPELHVPGRGLVLVVGLVALGAAFSIYRQPDTQSQWNASAPPSTPAPAASAVQTAEEDEVAQTEAVMAESIVDDTAAAEASAAPSEVATVTEPAATPEPAKEEVAAATAAAPDSGLSSTAAQLEAEARAPRRERVTAPTESKLVETASAAVIATPRATTPAPRSTPPTRRNETPRQTPPRSARNRARESYGPLTLHVHNRLGRDQRYEQLTLSIEGLAVADFDVDTQRPEVSVAVALPRPGLLYYRLEGFSDGRKTGELRGQGCIHVRDGSRFTVRRQPGSDQVFLEASRAG